MTSWPDLAGLHGSGYLPSDSTACRMSELHCARLRALVSQNSVRIPAVENTNVSCLTAPACISDHAIRPALGSRKSGTDARPMKSVALTSDSNTN